MRFSMQTRKRLTERAREALRRGDVASAVRDLASVLDCIQADDERYLLLYRDCLTLTEHASKVLASVPIPHQEIHRVPRP
jgi:hypothetical protein